MILAMVSRSRRIASSLSSCFIRASILLMPRMMRSRSVSMRMTFILTYTGSPLSMSR